MASNRTTHSSPPYLGPNDRPDWSNLSIPWMQRPSPPAGVALGITDLPRDTPEHVILLTELDMMRGGGDENHPSIMAAHCKRLAEIYSQMVD